METRTGGKGISVQGAAVNRRCVNPKIIIGEPHLFGKLISPTAFLSIDVT
jgi:hypothetical protein